ncbi:putative zinc finger protein [Schistosoma mansoni]|uniref:putative zinc finger protein n=1 Tax=Schistosoma mansoni TaxID=6183 RepID=UPI00022DC3D7|nr:putative zinc finger protein [Schistosoma mansoni]|eukprot:XP_018649388.1 putative zinc finger protein [Schistosoma mansoni]
MAGTSILQPNLSQTAELKSTLLYLPPITDSHRIALDSELKSASLSVVADTCEMQRRQNFANDLIAAIEARIPSNSSPQPVCGQSTNDTEQSMGIGYVLSNIFDLLQLNACESPTNTPQIRTISEKAASFNCSTGHNTKMNELSDKPKFPKFHTVLRTSGDYFYLCLTDFYGVRYRISTGNPYGYDLAKLINTYLNLNDQALQLAILFRKLSRLGHLDMPENGTFEETVIPLLVIFYLQHYEPPLLPNLHMLYRQHLDKIPENSYHQVLPPNTDCSFITDIELIRKLCPDQPYSSSSNNLPCLADLWLGFLRFYLFDFKISSCTINIVEPEPVPCFNAPEKRCFTVTDPFNPKHNLCRNLTQVSRDYINSQLLAAYGYFGVPRLTINGRHLFTHISVVEKSPVEPKDVCDKLDQNTSSSINQTTVSNDKMTTSAGIHLTPIIDDSDNFESNLNKSVNLWFDRLKLRNVVDDDISIDSLCGQSQEMNCSNENVFEDQDNHQLSPLEMNQDSNLLSKSDGDNYSEAIVEQSSNNFLDVEEYLNFDISMTVSDDAFLDCNFENDFNDGEILEHLESALDVDYSDDIIDPISTFSSFVDRNSEVLETLTPQGSNQKRIKSSDNNNLTSNDLNSVNHLSSMSCPSKELVTASNELIRRDDKDEEDATASTNKLAKKARKSEKKQQSHSNNILNPNNNTTASKSSPTRAKKRKTAKKLEWEDVISSRSAVAPPIDDDRPDYYNSKLLENLQPDDFDFKFVLHMNLSSNRRHNQSSVLGLASRNQPSTLLAHFDAPQPQCQACNLTGHRQSQCETTSDKSVSFLAWHKLLNKTPWPPIAEQIENLTHCLNCLEEHHETDNKVNARQELVKKIYECFSYRFPSVQLELFGSCANGFDLQTSDLDICVFFPVGSTEWHYLKDKNATNMLIRQFKKQLFYCKNRLNITHIQPILTARVPILKALSNTRMLAFYTKVEPKLRTLGIALKTVTKITKIGRAASGGISSYAWIIMLIHYLQQIDQLPVLQELYEGSTKPTTLVNGWNVWYQNDLSVINRLWKPANPSQPVGEMWLGFLRYYLFEFNHDKYVVTIRQKKLLIRFVKMWRSLFAIEEYIVVDRKLLRKNTLCFICNQTGHVAFECPSNKKKNKRENSDIVALHSLIGHFLHKTQASQSNSQKPMDQHYDNSNQNRQLNSTSTVCKTFRKPNNTPTNISSHTYRNPFKPQNSYQVQQIRNNFQQQPFISNYHHVQPHHVNMPTNLNSILPSVPYPTPLLPNNTVGFIPNYGFMPNSLSNHLVQSNVYDRQQSFPPSYYSPPLGCVNNQQQYKNTIQANHPVNYRPKGQQNNNNETKNYHKFSRVSSSSVYQEQLPSVTSNHPIAVTSNKSPCKPKKYNNNQNVSNPHQTNSVLRKSHNHEFESSFAKDSNCNNPGIINDHTSKSALPSSGNQTNSCSTTSYRQKQSNSPVKVKSNFQQSPQKAKCSVSNGCVIDSHEKRKYPITESNKVNSVFRGNRNCQRFGCPTKTQLSNNVNNNNGHLVDENLVKRLHNMSTTSSSSQSSNNKYRY